MTLPVAGLTPFSMVDWPGKIVATVFTQGCSWRCPYCQNPQLQNIRYGGTVPWRSIADFARRRVGKLDGFVFSGGEPTRHRELSAAITELRDLGFGVGLHTNGMYPSTLRQLLEANIVDWIGLDIKAGANALAYDAAIGQPAATAGRKPRPDTAIDSVGSRTVEAVWQSLELVQQWSAAAPGRAFEVRTTLFDDPRVVASLPELARDLAKRGIGVNRLDCTKTAAVSAGSWVLQHVRKQGTTVQFREVTEIGAHAHWEEVLAQIRQICPEVLVR